MGVHRCYGCMELTDQAVCPRCGWQAGQNNEPHQLPVGTVLREKYLIGKVLGQGGFGITYMAWDMDLELQVCVKEFFPRSAVNRDVSSTAQVLCTATLEESFSASRERFLREAKSLAKFRDVPQIVSIHDFFQMNNTAYMVMEFVKGIDLGRLVQLRGGRMAMDELLRILKPLLEALSKVHESGMIHRDISPDNIMLHPMDGPKLLDFGAVRSVERPDTEKELTHATEAILKHGFAPVEQYSGTGSLGPWTDVYAVTATIWYCLTGRIPENAPSRMLEDNTLDRSLVPDITDAQWDTLVRGLALKPKDRIASVKELMDGLYGEGAHGAVAVAAQVPVSGGSETGTQTAAGGTVQKKKKTGLAVLAAILALVILGGAGVGLWFASRVKVSGAELDDRTLERLLLEDYAAIGYYESGAMLPLAKTGETSFPIGSAYNGMEIVITDEDGEHTTANASRGTVEAELPVGGLYLLQVRTADTETLGWSEWSESLPVGVDLNDATVEIDIQYHHRDKEYAESNRETMAGWELFETFPSAAPYGQWSEWTEEKRTGDKYTEVEQQHQYRSCVYETMTSDQADLPGWTLDNTEHEYTFGPWGAWQENYIEETETNDVEVRTYYLYPFTRYVGSGVYSSGTIWITNNGLSAGSVFRSGYIGSSYYFDMITGGWTQRDHDYRARSRSIASTTYYYSRWGEWSEWGTEAVVANDTLQVEERNVYRTRDIYGAETYRFYRWLDWTPWTLEAPAEMDAESEYEQRIVYRYIP